MSLSRNHIKLIIITAFCAYFIASVAYAAPNNSGILDKITTDFETAARSWGSIILSYAEVLFWSLGVISLVYTSCMLFLKDSGMNAQGFFAHLIKFIMFFGFFLFLLRNGPYIGGTIINSLLQVGARATGTGATSASEFMDVAFDVFGQVLDSLSLWSPGLSLLLAMIAVLLLLILSLVAANLAIEYCAAWILLYAGCFFLGFGGSHWTSDIAIQYFKAVLGSAVRLMAMTMILGIAASIVTATAANMSEGPNGKDAATLLVTALIVLSIMNKIPNMLAGIVGGGQGAGNLGTGAMMAAAGLGMAAGAAVSGAASSMGVTSAMANGASAAKEAVSQGLAQWSVELELIQVVVLLRGALPSQEEVFPLQWALSLDLLLRCLVTLKVLVLVCPGQMVMAVPTRVVLELPLIQTHQNTIWRTIILSLARQLVTTSLSLCVTWVMT